MPLWRIFSDPSTFSAEQRDGLAKGITDLYVSRGLPAFYVVVLFIDLDKDHTYVGGEKKNNFVRIVAEQIARVMPDNDTEAGAKYRTDWLDKIHETLRPWILDRKELNMEFHIAETPRSLWRIDNLDPPPAQSEEEKMWVQLNKAVPWKQ